jgi:hypothetical protein
VKIFVDLQNGYFRHILENIPFTQEISVMKKSQNSFCCFAAVLIFLLTGVALAQDGGKIPVLEQSLLHGERLLKTLDRILPR